MTSTENGQPRRAERGYRRAISAVEQQFLACPAEAALALTLCVEGDGDITIIDLTRAVAIAGEYIPGSRCTPDDGWWVDTGIPPAVTDAGEVSGDIGDLAALRGRPGSDHQPWCEVLRATTEGLCTVVFRADHALMDAHGVVVWAAAVFAALRGETPETAADTITDSELAERCVADRPVAERGPAPVLNMEWPLVLSRPRAQEAQGFLWRRRSLEGVHPGLVARLIAGLAAREKRVRCLVPVDLRRHDASVSSTANLVLQVVLDATADDDWAHLHTRLLAALAEGRELDMRPSPAAETSPEIQRLLMDGLDKMTAAQRISTATAIVSHWGRLRRSDYCRSGFDARSVYTLPVVPPGTPMVIDAVEIEGRTDISIGWHGGPGAGPAAAQLLDDLADAVWSPVDPWDGNDTTVPVPPGTMVDAFDAVVATHGDAVAVAELDGTEFTYRELDLRAAAITRVLADRGVRRGDVVGLVAGRGVAAIAAIWGILRRGAAYLPLDVAHPDTRIRDLLIDAGVQVCLIEPPHEARPLTPDNVCAIPLDESTTNTSVPEIQSSDRPGPGDLAYVIYTSGSTGKPKGVQIEHRALVNYTHWAATEFGVRDDSRMPWITSLSFDVSATTLFAPTLRGGAIVPIAEEPSPDAMRTMLAGSEATEITLTPSHLDLIGRLDITAAGVRALAVIGEQLRTPVARRAREVFGPTCRIHNEYGPTEATVGVSVHEYDDEIDGGPDAAAVVPIGRPMNNCTMHILDADGRHAPPGEVGRLFLGGVQLARGYRGRPDLDTERFVRLVDGERVYDTGDLAMIRPSGTMEFHGRNDDQIKILGHRIEPAEIAQVTEEHPAIAQAFVLARPPRPGSTPVLCLWARVDPTVSPPSIVDVQDHLRDRLPHYMVPVAIVLVDALPQTVNGKVDALSLPDPFGGDVDAGPLFDDTSDVPVDEITVAVSGIWRRILDLPAGVPPAVDVDFHRFGGNSLSLLLMIDSVDKEVVGADGGASEFAASIGALIRNPTIAHVAELARAARDRAGTTIGVSS